MATIKEMAARHNLCNNDQTTMAYRLGAIEVLEVFKEIIENRNFLAFPKSVHQELLDKIKELKGE